MHPVLSVHSVSSTTKAGLVERESTAELLADRRWDRKYEPSPEESDQATEGLCGSAWRAWKSGWAAAQDQKRRRRKTEGRGWARDRARAVWSSWQGKRGVDRFEVGLVERAAEALSRCCLRHYYLGKSRQKAKT